MTPLARWDHRVEQLGRASDWSRVPIALDLDGAVTLVASIEGDAPRLAPSSEDDIWTYCHEAAVDWHLQDSLDGTVWHDLAHGRLVHGVRGNVARVSTPVGTHARIILWSPVLVAHVRKGNGVTQNRQACNDSACAVDHEALRTDLDLRVVVRSI